MKPSGRSARSLAALLVALLAHPAAAGQPALARHEASRMSMGCEYAIVAYGDDARALQGMVESAFDEVDRMDRLMSHYKPESPLSRLNREAARGPVAVPAELFDLIAESLRYSRESGGAFDVTVGPLMKAWGFFRGEGRVPGDAEIEELRSRVGHAHVVLDAATTSIRFDRPGVELDLGGIAKGYAVDRAVAVLKRAGVKAALVSAGGSTLFGLGAPPGRKGWKVEIQDPIDSRKVALGVLLKDRALSVAGRAEKSFERDGVIHSHIMDPRTARPVQGMLSVAVLADSGTAGDALDDVFFVQGVEAARTQIRRYAGTEAIVFVPDGGRRFRVLRLRPSSPSPSGRGRT